MPVVLVEQVESPRMACPTKAARERPSSHPRFSCHETKICDCRCHASFRGIQTLGPRHAWPRSSGASTLISTDAFEQETERQVSIDKCRQVFGQSVCLLDLVPWPSTNTCVSRHGHAITWLVNKVCWNNDPMPSGQAEVASLLLEPASRGCGRSDG